MVAVSLKKFFFQAEDGIRDHCVTGVQTCALPIFLGAVIRGETPHFDCVVNAVTSGTAALAANGKIPVIFGVLTTDNVDQAMARSGLKGGNKGADCAETAVEMVNLYKELA